MLFATFVAASLLSHPVRACPQPNHFAFNVLAQPARVAIRTDMGLDQIDELAERAGKTLQQHPLGFYAGRFFYRVRVEAPAPNAACPDRIRVSINMDLASRVIEIGQELRDKPCRFAAAVRHYRKHAEADEAVFTRYLALTVTALRTASPPHSTEDATMTSLSPAEITVWVRSVVDRTLEGMTPDRDAAQAAVDTSEEMQSLRLSCERLI